MSVDKMADSFKKGSAKVLSTNYVKQSSGRVARIIRLVKFMHIHVIIGLV